MESSSLLQHGVRSRTVGEQQLLAEQSYAGHPNTNQKVLRG